MDKSTARLIATAVTVFGGLLVAGAGLLFTVLLGILLFGFNSCTQRDFLYGLQRHLLWPVGIHLTDTSWNAIYGFLNVFCGDSGLLIAAILGILLAFYCSHGWLRRLHRNVIEQNRPTTYPSCPQCWYNITGNESGVCPECGADLHEPTEVSGRIADDSKPIERV